MPKNYSSKKKLGRERTNMIRAKVAMVDETALFAKVVKPLGNSRFRILCPDTKGKTTVEVDARIGGNSVTRILMGDIAIIGRNTSSDHETYEILGKLDIKQIKELQKARRLHSSLIEGAAAGEGDLGIVFDYGEEEKKEEEEDVNVDAI
jgi:translation initiation factor IF-1